MADVWGAIKGAKVIVADCTDRDPNVFYEIGIAHVIGKPVILLSQTPEDVPFDVSQTRRRERQMKRFRSAGQAQRFLSAHDQINNLFHLRRDHVTAAEHRASRTQSFRIWAEICSVG